MHLRQKIGVINDDDKNHDLNYKNSVANPEYRKSNVI